MTKCKRLLTLAICLILALSVAATAAAEVAGPPASGSMGGEHGTPGVVAPSVGNTITVEVVDGVTGTVKISGTAPSGEAGDVVTLLVTNLEADDENNDIEDVVSSLATRVQYQDTVITGAEGRFEKTFMINIDTAIPDITDGSVEFNFYAGGEGYEGSQVATGYLWYAPIDAKIAAAKAVVEEADAATAGALIVANKAVFAVDGVIFAELDKTKLATLLAESTTDVDFLEATEANLEANIVEYEKFDAALRLSIAIEGFNQNKKEQIISGSTIANDSLLGLTSYVETQGTLNTIYTTKINNTGKAKVIDGLFGKDAHTAADLQKVFAKEILVQGLKNNKQNGSGIVGTVLTEDNLAAAGYDIVTTGDGTLKSEYINLTSKANVNNDIYQKRSTLTAENLEAEIIASATKSYVVEEPETDPTPSVDRGNVSVGGGIAAPKAKFSDLNGYDWAKTAIEALAEKNIINGVAADKFSPAGTLTREQAAKIICLAAGIEPASEASAFADVSSGAWYSPYIVALNKKGIINGVSETSFGVGKNVTREDFAVMICRALEFSATKEGNFTDKATISAYAADAVNALYERGIVGGYEDGSFKPKANITRAEGAKIIYGILSK